MFSLYNLVRSIPLDVFIIAFVLIG
uniref:Uncharacterized protein n=1 Tax=Arundo donax TaxID=35708 RepID=A0A0A8ZF90_ARUDO